MDAQNMNGNTQNECQCNNNYNSNTFMESFAKDDDALRNCSSCPNFQCNGGMYICIKFNK